MSSRGVFFDRRGNPTPLALALVCGVCVYVYRGSDGTASHATHARAPAVNGKIPLPHHTAGGDDAELQRALRRIPVDPAADARTVIDRRVRRDPLPKAPVVVAIPQPPPPPPLADRVPIPGERLRRVERVPVPDYRPVSLNLQLPDKYLNEPALENREKMFRQYALPLFRLQTETGRDWWGGWLNGTSRGVWGVWVMCSVVALFRRPNICARERMSPFAPAMSHRALFQVSPALLLLDGRHDHITAHQNRKTMRESRESLAMCR